MTDVAEHGVLVSLSTSVRGLLPPEHMSKDDTAQVTKKFRSLFKRGMGVRVVVRKVDEERRGLILSLNGESSRVRSTCRGSSLSGNAVMQCIVP